MNPNFGPIVVDIIDHYLKKHSNAIWNAGIPSHEYCLDSCELIGEESRGDILYYRLSITVDSTVVSSTTGRNLELMPITLENSERKEQLDLFWIRQSEGYDNARIIAHILSDDYGRVRAYVAR